MVGIYQVIELVLTECQLCAQCFTFLSSVTPLPAPVRWVALSPYKRRLPVQVTGSGRIDFQPSVFQRPAIHSFILGNSALGIEASHLGFHSVLKGENIISFDILPKCTLQRKKNPKFKCRVFLFLSPLLLLCTSYSLRSWDSLITAVAIITHLYFCRALLRSWESFINTSLLVVPAAWQVEGSHCLKRMGLWSCPDWHCRCCGARGLGCLEPFAGTVICLRHQSLKAAWSLALGHLAILEFHNKTPWSSTAKTSRPLL